MKNREEIANNIQSMNTDALLEFVDAYIKKDEELNWLKEQLAMVNKVRYSSKSEKAVVGQLNLFDEVEEISDTAVLEELVKKVKNKKKREANFSKLPTKVIHHELTKNVKKIEISRASMSNWLMNCAKQVEPVYKHMQEDIKKASHIHMDETPVTVLEDKQEEGREKSYMWMAATGKHEK